MNLDFCVSSASVWQLVGYALFILKVLVPLIIIILGVIDFVKALTANKDDAINAAVKSVLIRFVVGIVIFFIPLIISTIFTLIKDASPFIAKGDACQLCLLRPFSDGCSGYKETAKAYYDNQRNDNSHENNYEVYIEGCYKCGNGYIWTNNPDVGCTKLERETSTGAKFTKALCEEVNNDPSRQEHTNTAQKDKGNEDDNETSTGGGSNDKSTGRALSEDELEKKYKELENVPTYDELFSLAKQKYSMNEDAFKVSFGWAISEAYDRSKNSAGKVDYYLSYLTACVGINRYMGLGITDAVALARSIQGGGPYSLYSADKLISNVDKAINGGSYYDSTFKIMYLALKYPDENAHDCDGLSNYESLGGKKYYVGGIYDGKNVINVWSLWQDGYKHWVTGEENE